MTETVSERSSAVASPFNRHLAVRAAGFSGIAAAVALLVVSATDEGATWAERIAMTSALLPVAGAIGATAAAATAAARGELRALALLGVSRARASAGAIVGGVAIALASPVLASSGSADLAALFPRAPGVHAWTSDATGLRAPSLGLHVAPGGVLEVERPVGETRRAPAASAATVSSLALAALALPTSAWAPRSGARALAAIAIALAAALVCFQAVAAGRLAPAWVAFPPFVLLVDAVFAVTLGRGRS